MRDLTLEEVHAAFRSSWAPDHRLIMVTGNADLSARQEGLKRPSQRFSTSRRTAVKPPVDKEIIAFPYLSPPAEPGRIKERTDSEDLDIVQVVYENGFRLNLKKTDFKDNEVVANLSFGAGRSRSPRTLPGLAELSMAVINESALGRLDKDELDAALAGRNTRWFLTLMPPVACFDAKPLPGN